MMYAGLKQHGVSAELHVYENGGHGYGTRQRPNSNIGSWPDPETDWLVQQKLGREEILLASAALDNVGECR